MYMQKKIIQKTYQDGMNLKRVERKEEKTRVEKILVTFMWDLDSHH